MPAAFAYLAVSPDSAADPDMQEAVAAAGRELAGFAARKGYVLAGVFTDVRGSTETGLYGMLAAVRQGRAVAVVVPDLRHLRHAGCLAGADPLTASRYLRLRLLPMHPDPDAPRDDGSLVERPPDRARTDHPPCASEPPWPWWSRVAPAVPTTSGRRAAARRERGTHR